MNAGSRPETRHPATSRPAARRRSSGGLSFAASAALLLLSCGKPPPPPAVAPSAGPPARPTSAAAPWVKVRPGLGIPLYEVPAQVLSAPGSVAEIMAPLRDFQLLVDDAGFDVWEDFEFVVMGSPDFTDPTQAFVAVQYKFGHAEMKAGIDRACKRDGMVVDWREEQGATIGEIRIASSRVCAPRNVPLAVS